MTERTAGFGERLLAGFSAAVPEVSQPFASPVEDMSGAYRRIVEPLITAAAAAGDVVILGRLGNAVLGARADLVRVFLYAPLDWRIANVRASLGCTAAQARSEIHRIDDARRTYAREHYRLAWGDPRNYDIVVNTARYGVDGTAAIVAAALRAVQST